MERRHVFLLVLAVVTAAAVAGVWITRPRGNDPERHPLPSDPRSTFVDYGDTETDDRGSLAFTRIFGYPWMCPRSMDPYVPSDDALQARVPVQVKPEHVAMLTTAESDTLLLRGGTRVRGWLDGQRRVLVVEAGEAYLDAGDREWEVRSERGAIRGRNLELAFKTSGDNAVIAVLRGPGLAVSGDTRLEIAEGEVVTTHAGRISGSMNDEPEAVVAWVREARGQRNLLKGEAIAAKPSARYQLRGRAATGDVVASADGRELGRWAGLSPVWCVTFQAPADAKALAIEGRFETGELFEIGAP